eukprot:scaffold191750_cov31-Tisochrysis_lutea.AAC.3
MAASLSLWSLCVEWLASAKATSSAVGGLLMSLACQAPFRPSALRERKKPHTLLAEAELTPAAGSIVFTTCAPQVTQRRLGNSSAWATIFTRLSSKSKNGIDGAAARGWLGG